MKKQLTFTKVDRTKRYNMINPDATNDRCGDYDLTNAIREKWEHTTKDFSGNGNVNMDCSFDIDKGEINWHSPEDWMKKIGISNIISSPLMLYRLICVFVGTPVIVKDPYKTIWWYHIEHKATGKILGFGEWKGAVGFWLPEGSHTQLKSDFKSDLDELLLFLVSDQVAHPYDGCTAGQIA